MTDDLLDMGLPEPDAELETNEIEALKLLAGDWQLSDFYLQLNARLSNTISLVNFILQYLLTGLFDTSFRLGLAFVLCQIVEEPAIYDPISHYWSFQPQFVEQLLLYELVIEKNFREFISLNLSQLEAKV